mmetsp:Transcript_31396/g.72827  ORF Transcript_31396/g.72827 Transcript_31396/m.72827 type:complete len:212 (-) Transcript_31396:63-698(-)
MVEAIEVMLVLRILLHIQSAGADTHGQRIGALVQDCPDHDSPPERWSLGRRVPRHAAEYDPVTDTCTGEHREPLASKVCQLVATRPVEAPVRVMLKGAVLEAPESRRRHALCQRDPARGHKEQVAHTASGGLQKLRGTRQRPLLSFGHEADPVPRQTSRRGRRGVRVMHRGSGAELQQQLSTIEEGDGVGQQLAFHPQLGRGVPGLGRHRR